ncbi:MAG: hypothetical protein E7065_02905 [Lentimicrobiaceae bacterium]|nr:hypothetical protein [Lentimicrobiaceae bacterium]
MRTENGNYYYEVGDILYFPHIDYNREKYTIEELKVVSVDEIRTTLSESKNFQKHIGLQHTSKYTLFTKKDEAINFAEQALKFNIKHIDQ